MTTTTIDESIASLDTLIAIADREMFALETTQTAREDAATAYLLAPSDATRATLDAATLAHERQAFLTEQARRLMNTAKEAGEKQMRAELRAQFEATSAAAWPDTREIAMPIARDVIRLIDCAHAHTDEMLRAAALAWTAKTEAEGIARELGMLDDEGDLKAKVLCVTFERLVDTVRSCASEILREQGRGDAIWPLHFSAFATGYVVEAAE